MPRGPDHLAEGAARDVRGSLSRFDPDNSRHPRTGAARGSSHKAGGGKGPSKDDNPHSCGAAARMGASPITRARPSQINYSGILVGREPKGTKSTITPDEPSTPEICDRPITAA